MFISTLPYGHNHLLVEIIDVETLKKPLKLSNTARLCPNVRSYPRNLYPKLVLISQLKSLFVSHARITFGNGDQSEERKRFTDTSPNIGLMAVSMATQSGGERS